MTEQEHIPSNRERLENRLTELREKVATDGPDMSATLLAKFQAGIDMLQSELYPEAADLKNPIQGELSSATEVDREEPDGYGDIPASHARLLRESGPRRIRVEESPIPQDPEARQYYFLERIVEDLQDFDMMKNPEDREKLLRQKSSLEHQLGIPPVPIGPVATKYDPDNPLPTTPRRDDVYTPPDLPTPAWMVVPPPEFHREDSDDIGIESFEYRPRQAAEEEEHLLLKITEDRERIPSDSHEKDVILKFHFARQNWEQSGDDTEWKRCMYNFLRLPQDERDRLRSYIDDIRHLIPIGADPQTVIDNLANVEQNIFDAPEETGE